MLFSTTTTLTFALASLLFASAGPEDLLSDPKAREYVGEAEIMFAEGRFADAAGMLEKAYLIEPKAELLFPWAQAEREQGHCDVATELYGQFLESINEGPMADAARQNIERCEGEVAVAVPPDEEFVEVIDDDPEPVVEEPVESEPDSEPPPPKATPKDDAPKAKKWYRDPAGGVLTGLGVAGVGAGVALLVIAGSTAKAAPDAANLEDYRSDGDRATTFRNAGAGVLTVGGALLVGGIVRYAVVAKKSKSNATASLWYAPDSGGVAVSGRF